MLGGHNAGMSMEMRWRYIAAYLLLVGTYVLGTLTAPVTGNTYGLSRMTLGLLQLTLIVPIVLIWVAGLSGASHLRRYVETVDSRSGRIALRSIALGVGVLVTGLIVSTLLGTLRPYAIQHGWAPTQQIMTVYTTMLFTVLGMYLLYRGTARLKVTVPVRRNALALVILGMIAIAMLTLLFASPYRNSTPDPARYTSYYLPDILIVGTVLVPYLVGWACGLLASVRLWAYRKRVAKGDCEAAFARIAVGISSVVAISITLQALVILGGALRSLPLAALLGVVYTVLVVYGLGYVLIAAGARRLQRTVTT